MSRGLPAMLLIMALAPSGVRAQSTGVFAAAGNMTMPRSWHSATRLADGTVLIIGGNRDRPASAEIYDPATGSFTAAGDMTTARSGFSATLLQGGAVLIAGGDPFSGTGPVKSTAELFDPSTRRFTATADLVTVHIGGTATLLKDGKVLIAGGTSSVCCNPSPAVASTPELYDPATGTFTLTGRFASAGDGFFTVGGPNVSAATLLPDGRVLIAGEPASELYDPVTGTFSVTGPMMTPCDLGGYPMYIGGRTATVLMTGQVLLAGGAHEDCGRFADAELYDPTTGAFTPTGKMTRARDNHTATLLLDGTVLIAGGESHECSARGCIFSGTDAGAEIYDPASGVFTAVGNMAERRAGHSATRLANGAVLISGGYAYAGIGAYSCCFASAELYIAAAPAVTLPGASRSGVITPDLRPPAPLVGSGSRASIGVVALFRVSAAPGAFGVVADMSSARFLHTATRLTDGRVLVAGGASALWGGPTVVEASAELYDPDTKRFTETGSMKVARWSDTATLLRDGRILIAGGSNGSGIEASAEVYDPSTGMFTATGDMTVARAWHTATLLADGRVLIAGGTGYVNGREAGLASAEMYDPEVGRFTATGDMLEPTADTATLLSDGTVLITKSIVGWDPSSRPSEMFVRHAELYDPSTGRFVATGDMLNFHASPTATLLVDGRVLIAGGDIGDGDGASVKAELYDPITRAFVETGALTTGRQNHTATLLADGTVLIIGGHGGVRVAAGLDNLASAELYDPATGGFQTAGDLATGRESQTATLLGNGGVLVTGGTEYVPFGAGSRPPVFGLLASAELYTVIRDASSAAVRVGPAEIVLARGGVRGGVAMQPVRPASPGAPALSLATTDDAALGHPSGLVATASGSGVVLTWIAPQGVTPAHYAVTGGAAPHTSTLPVVVTPDASTRYTFPALPPGRYFFTVSAILARGLSAPSNEAEVVASGSASGSAPPTGAVALSDAHTVTLTWTRVQGAAVYYVDVGSAPGRRDVALLTTTETSVTYGAQPGVTYYLRVRAARGASVSGPSNEVTVSAAASRCAAPPFDPVLLPASTTAGETTISWLPGDSSPIDHYRIDATGAAGPLTMSARGTGTSLRAALKPGAYGIRVTAINACGISAASNQITFTQPAN